MNHNTCELNQSARGHKRLEIKHSYKSRLILVSERTEIFKVYDQLELQLKI